MRTLTATLTAAMKSASRVPVIKLEAHNKICGVERFDFTRLYTGAEADSSHGCAIAGDGSLIRARLSAGAIWTQRVTAPGPSSDYTVWTNSGIATAYPIAVAACGAVVDIFFINTAPDQVRRLHSVDNGVTYANELILALGAPALLPTSRIAAAYSTGPGANVVVFYIFGTVQSVYWTYWNGNLWTPWAWQNIGGGASIIQQIAACGPSNDSDFAIALCGTNTLGDRKLWRTVFNYAGQVFADADESTSFPVGSAYTPTRPFVLEIDGPTHLWFVQDFTGVTAYSRIFHAWTPPGGDFQDTPTTEPDPVDHTCTEGLAPALSAGYVWLTKPAGVWRSTRTVTLADLSADVLRIRTDEDPQGGKLLAEIDNSAGKYATPGSGAIAALSAGCELRLGPGYRTTAADEYVWANYYQVDAMTHVYEKGKATLLIEASLPRRRLSFWTARGALRWNGGTAPGLVNVYNILRILFARAGLYLKLKSFSAIADTFLPDFTVYPGQHGDSAIGQLLKLLPDVIRSDLACAEFLYPQAADAADYAGYGTTHAILSSAFETPAPLVTRVRAEGRNAGAPVVGDAFDFAGILKVSDRLRYIFDLNIDSAADAADRGTAYFRDAAIAALGGSITVPVNPGQQLYDVVTVTDALAGLSAAKRRVLGLRLTYDAPKNVYAHTLALGAP